MNIVEYIIGIILRILLVPFMILSFFTGGITFVLFIVIEYIFGFRVGPEKECKLGYYFCYWPFIVYEYYEDKYLSNESIY